MVHLCILADRPMHLRVLLASLNVQTHREWSADVLDQGIGSSAFEVVEQCWNPRVIWRKVARVGDWGQTVKFEAAQRARAEWVGFPNDDAYYCPRYLELMLQHAQTHDADLVYCDWVSASDMGVPYVAYYAHPSIGLIDVGGFLVKRDVLVRHGWPDRGPTGDGQLIASLVASGVRHVRVPHVLYVKN